MREVRWLCGARSGKDGAELWRGVRSVRTHVQPDRGARLDGVAHRYHVQQRRFPTVLQTHENDLDVLAVEHAQQLAEELPHRET